MFWVSPKTLNFLQALKFSLKTAKYFGKNYGDIKYVLEKSEPLYDGHIPTTFLQKLILTVGSSAFSISDVYRHDMVAVMGETTGYWAAKSLRHQMLQNPEGKSVLENKPRINSKSLNYEYLKSLPSNTLGHAYMSFLQNHNVTPDSRRNVTFVDDSDIAYVIQRYREIHDLNHTLLSMPTNMLGEVAIKWVEAIQTRFPMCVSAALVGPIRLKPKQRQKYVETYLPWAIECGHKAKLLMNIYYENRWAQDLCDLKKELNIPEFSPEC